MANRNHTFKHTPKLYKKPTQLAQASANSESLAKTPTQSANGVKNSGKHSQTHLQYGRTNFSESATSLNGGVSVINLSDKAKAILALSEELKDLEKLQLEVGEQMAKLVFDQMRLAEKCRIINCSMEALLK